MICRDILKYMDMMVICCAIRGHNDLGIDNDNIMITGQTLTVLK